MANKRDSEELIELFKEYETLIVLEQHDKVSKLGSKICANLVESLDEDLSDEIDNDDKKAKAAKSSTLDFIENVCSSIFHQGKIAAAYAEVREFVRIRDLVCLSKLVKAIPDKSHEDELIIDLECLSRILRQCIYLLKCINEFSSTSFEEFEDNKLQHHDLWLDKSYVSNFRSKNYSFPVYRIDDINKALISLSNDNQISKSTKIANHLKNLVEILPDDTGKDEEERLSNRIFSSSWFKEFINNNLSKAYPLSRFTVLIAIWIISVDCSHKVLEQLTGELIDQIYHEEANSNNEEELLQLTQVGSFWVTYHKKYTATLRQVNLSQIYDDNDNGEISSHDNTSESLSPSSSSLASSNSSVSLLHGHHNLGETLLTDEGKDEDNDGDNSLQVDLKFKLKQLINEELLHGIKCIICSYEPTELFEPLNTNSCPKCANQKPVERCSISYRPLELVCFNSLMKFKPNIRKLVLVSPNEWARYIIAPKLACLRIGLKLAKNEDNDQTFSEFKQHQQKEGEQQQVVERVVVAGNYERLTVIRGGDINQARQKVDKKEDSDDSSSTPFSPSSSLSSSSTSSSLAKEENQDSLSDDDGQDEDEKEDEDEEETKNKFDRRMKRRKSKKKKKKVTGNQRSDGDTYISILENYIKVRLKHSDNRIGGRKIGRYTNSSSLSETIEMFKTVVSNNSSNTTILPVCLTDLLIMDTNHDNVDGGRMMFKLALVTSNNKLFESGSLWSCSNRSLISKVRLGCGSVFSSLELVRLGSQSGSNEFTCPLCYCQPLIRLRKLNEEL